MATKPTILPEWNSTETRVIEPTSTQKSSGWVWTGTQFEKPKGEHLNFWMNLVYKWVSYLDSSKPTGYKNYIINGNFKVNQRDYISGTATTTNNEYTLDRWRIPTSGDSVSFTTTNGVTTVTVPSSGIEQIIEPMLINTYTLSFSGTATATVSESSDNTTYTVITANTDGSYTLSGYNFVKVNLANGTVSNVQLEEGPVATPFEHRPYGLELSLCQRYYQNVSIGWTYMQYAASVTGRSVHNFPVEMRDIPTTTDTIVTQSNVESPTSTNASSTKIEAQANSAAAGAGVLRIDVALDAEL